MKPIYQKLRDAASDETLSDATFRRAIREMFDHRQHGETWEVALTRTLDRVKSENEGY